MINASFATFLATPDTFPPPENWTSTRTWHSILLPLTRSIWSRDNDGNAFQRFYLMRGFDRKLAFEENIFSLETIYPILDGLNIDGRRKEGEKHACANYFGENAASFPERHFPRTRISRPKRVTFHAGPRTACYYTEQAVVVASGL